MHYRSTPVECLHTILLGSYKYLTGSLMDRLTPMEKKEVIAKCRAFPSSGLPGNISPESLCRHNKSFHGRDYKLVAQYIIFVVWEHLTSAERKIWKALSKV